MGGLILVILLLVILGVWLACRNHASHISTATPVGASGSDDMHQPAAYRLPPPPREEVYPPANHDGRGINVRLLPVQAGSHSSRHTHQIPDREIHLFIQEVIKRFESQAIYRQFAVLILASQKNLTETKFQTKKGVVSASNPATNYKCATFPADHNLCNFVTARPKDQHHAEALLMRKFGMLRNRYQELKMPPYQCIVLYTWLLPCDYCTRQILKTLARETLQHDVILVYTSKMPEVSDEEEKYTVSTLRGSGITVKREA